MGDTAENDDDDDDDDNAAGGGNHGVNKSRLLCAAGSEETCRVVGVGRALLWRGCERLGTE